MMCPSPLFSNAFRVRFRFGFFGSRRLGFKGLGRSVSGLGLPLVFLKVFFKFSVFCFGLGFGLRVSVQVSGSGFRFRVRFSCFGFLLFCLGFSVFSWFLLVGGFKLLVCLFVLRGPGLGLPSWIFFCFWPGFVAGVSHWFPMFLFRLGCCFRSWFKAPGPDFFFNCRLFLLLSLVVAPSLL